MVLFIILMVLFFVFVVFLVDFLWLCDFILNIMVVGMEEMMEINNRVRISLVFIFLFIFFFIGFYIISKCFLVIKSKIKFEKMINE